MVAFRTILALAAVPTTLALRPKIPHKSGSKSDCDSDETEIANNQCCPGYQLTQSSTTYCCVVDDDADNADKTDGSNCLAKVDVTDSDYKKKVKDADKDSGATVPGVALGVVIGAVVIQLM